MRKILIAVLITGALLLFVIAAAIAQAPPADDVLSGDQCKTCHPNEHAVWAGTLHPKSIEAVKSSDHASESCLHCMNTEYRYDETVTVESAQYGVTCAACHTPHDVPGDAVPAVADVAVMCNDCHNAHLEEGAAEFEPGATARHPTKEMYAGLGAVGVASTPSKHAFGCNTCHIEGHLYTPAQSTCDGCHGGSQTIAALEEKFAPRLAELGEMENLADGWPAAYTNYTMLSNDKSNGAHNFAYASAILDAINTTLLEPPAEAPAEEAAPAEPAEPATLPETGGATPLWGTPAILVLVGILALAAGLAIYAWDRRSKAV